MTTVPNYYHKFNCIADKCTHNCCIGWEIDIDDDTLQLYNLLPGEMGDRIRANIEGDVPHFVLGDGDRCPFLNEKGLCDIITEYNEDMLCEICSLHPRFRNFYCGFTEIGLGLCCEEAARIILGEKEKFTISIPKIAETDAEEKEFLSLREHIFDIVQNREESIKERFCRLGDIFGLEFKFPLKELCKFYLSLERLDEQWTYELEKLTEFSFDEDIFDDENLKIPFEQLFCYFIFRHLGEAMYDGDYAARINFALMSCYLIGALCSYYKEKNGIAGVENMAYLARMYSSEVEYSEENMEKVWKKSVIFL